MRLSAEENKAIVNRYAEEVWNKGKLDRFDEFVARDVVPHASTGPADAEAMKESIAHTLGAIPA